MQAKSAACGGWLRWSRYIERSVDAQVQPSPKTISAREIILTGSMGSLEA
ncbi:hypothetical protein [Methanomethylovorans sp.]